MVYRFFSVSKWARPTSTVFPCTSHNSEGTEHKDRRRLALTSGTPQALLMQHSPVPEPPSSAPHCPCSSAHFMLVLPLTLALSSSFVSMMYAMYLKNEYT